ncbi:MAG: hypothetical protein GXY55_13165 [Phycisphaerae bacterium]|nr:hypothetical protein [Phycisphaerae bacterium]
MMQTRRTIRWGRWIGLGGGLLVLSALVTGWMLFQHIPSWYQPMAIPPDQRQAVRDDFVGTFDNLSEGLIESRRSFDCRFTQNQLNAWLAAREEMWPASRHWLPRFMKDPHVVIDNQGIRLAVKCRQRGVEMILHARLQAQMEPDGINLRLIAVSAGSLPMPRRLIEDQLASLDGSQWPAGERFSSQIGNRPVPPLSALFDGIVIPNGWIWQNGEQPFKITGLRFGRGEVVVTFQPLPRSSWQGAH